MSNEELCMLARGGDQDALEQLWENVRRLCFKIATSRGYLYLYEQRGMDNDDLGQDLFLSMCLAVGSFKPEKETKFTSYLLYPIQKVCVRDVLKARDGKFHEVQTRNIDAPIGEDSDTTLSDILPDPAAQQQLEDVESDLYTEQLREALERGLSALSDRKQEAMRLHFFDGLTRKEAAQRMGVTHGRVRQLIDSGCLQMKRNNELQAYRDDIISRKGTRGTSFTAWKGTGCSVQESIVLYLEEKEQEERNRMYNPPEPRH